MSRKLLIIQSRGFLAQLMLLKICTGTYVYLLQVRKPTEYCALWASSVSWL